MFDLTGPIKLSEFFKTDFQPIIEWTQELQLKTIRNLMTYLNYILPLEFFKNLKKYQAHSKKISTQNITACGTIRFLCQFQYLISPIKILQDST